jgi:hypothetical protein
MAKGGSFELEVAKKLSLWLTDGKRDDAVCRNDTSGGRATVRLKNKKKTNIYMHGDLKHSDDLAKPLFDLWSVECKTGYASKSILKNGTKKVTHWDVLDLLDSRQKKPMVCSMWEQCVNDAVLSGRQPVLIFRRNQKEVCVTINLNYYLTLCSYFNVPGNIIEAIIPNIQQPNNLIVIMKFSEFLEWTDSKTLIDMRVK